MPVLNVMKWPKARILEIANRPPPKPKALELQIDNSDSQLPFYEETFDHDLKLPAVVAGNLSCKVEVYCLKFGHYPNEASLEECTRCPGYAEFLL
jgi:hypothetical protein